MFGISPKLPLKRDPVDGAYALNKTYTSMIKQNFRMLMLTNPGERVMLPDFGAGLSKFLFENEEIDLKEQISDAVETQVKKYMPFIKIDEIQIQTPSDNRNNSLYIRINYKILPLSAADFLEISLGNVN